MAKKPPRPGSPEPDRRWRIPPVPAHVSHSFAGAALLDELAGPLGFALWQSFRDVQLWSVTAPHERTRLFAPGAARARAVPPEVNGPDSELRAPLRTLLAMVEDAPGTRPDDVGRACGAIARWAEARGAPASALAFAEAAAGASPDDSALAFEAGRLARRSKEYGRAETWFLRSAGLGRRSGNWVSYVSAYLGMGFLYIQRGILPRARKAFLRALGAARRHGVRDLEGEALHDLMMVEYESGNLSRAEAWGREAYRVYGPGHRLLPRFAHDLAMIWIAQGHSTRALAVFRALLPHFEEPADRLFVLSNIARAAGAAGDRPTFHEAWSSASELAGTPHAQHAVAHVMLEMARGAVALGEMEMAERALVRSAQVAADWDEAKVRVEAEVLLQAVRSGAAAGADPTSAGDPGEDAAGDLLAGEIIQGLKAASAS